MNKLFIDTFLIILIFLLSGYDKIFNVNSLAIGLQKKIGFNLPLIFFIIVIIAVILLEIIGSLTILYSAYVNKNEYKKYAKYSVIGLIIFTVLATILYHMPPYGSEYYSFIKNVSIIGGLSLLLNEFNS